jgi:DNA-binding transcriptional ArsR family regulator
MKGIASIGVAAWSFLTNHARVLIHIANDPSALMRDIADATGITERTARGIVTDLTDAGYVIKERDGRRNRYRVQLDHELHEPTTRVPTLGALLTLIVGPADTTTTVADEGRHDGDGDED